MVKETFQNIGRDKRMRGQNSRPLWVETGEKRLESTSQESLHQLSSPFVGTQPALEELKDVFPPKTMKISTEQDQLSRRRCDERKERSDWEEQFATCGRKGIVGGSYGREAGRKAGGGTTPALLGRDMSGSSTRYSLWKGRSNAEKPGPSSEQSAAPSSFSSCAPEAKKGCKARG